jgi:N-methylhydantoinase A
VGIRVGIDTGGTFTDLVALDEESGAWFTAKVPSSPADPVRALARVLIEARLDPAKVSSIVVGTTIGINAVLTRTGARVIYLTTRGFEDVPHIQRINRKYHYDFQWQKPAPLVNRRDCVGVDERVNAEGKLVRVLDPDEVRRVLPTHAGEDVAVAVCFLFSYLNPTSELAARDALQSIDADLPVSLSHEIAPIWREYERGTAAILDAYLKPKVERYVAGVTEACRACGVRSNWSLLKSNGGHAVSGEAQARPSHVLLSGIAGGAIGGAYVARAGDAPRAIALDMGGTSCDVCLILDGRPLFSSEFEIEFGLPVAVPTVSTKTIGAGGGSIGWIDPGGFLQVGPQSAGADPGPACYARGGTEPTLTDANLVLGRLNPDFLLGGTIPLDRERSRRALERLGPEVEDVASSMIRVANENMANAARIVTVERGVDPRDHALIAMGGAGPTHAAEIAEAIGIDRVIVPLHPGLTSALGALVAHLRVDEVQSVNLESTVRADTVNERFERLQATAVEKFRAQGTSSQAPRVTRAIAMRYQGQNYEEELSLPPGAITAAVLDAVVERYHDRYDEYYGYRLEGVAVEFVRISVTVAAAEHRLPPLRLGAADETEPSDPRGRRFRQVHFGATGPRSALVMHRAELIGADEQQGPLIIESVDTTIVVPPGWSVQSDATGLLEMRRVGDSDAEARAKALATTG